MHCWGINKTVETLDVILYCIYNCMRIGDDEDSKVYRKFLRESGMVES